MCRKALEHLRCLEGRFDFVGDWVPATWFLFPVKLVFAEDELQLGGVEGAVVVAQLRPFVLHELDFGRREESHC